MIEDKTTYSRLSEPTHLPIINPKVPVEAQGSSHPPIEDPGRIICLSKPLVAINGAQVVLLRNVYSSSALIPMSFVRTKPVPSEYAAFFRKAHLSPSQGQPSLDASV